ncbi:MAG: DUF721 domain-containing protein [Puniceicoccales bacterium]|nr:DUF721 domain-containing protein [Puniceicoccales bacterium]
MARRHFSRCVRNLIADLRLLPHEENNASLRRSRQIGSIVDAVIKNFTIKSRCEDILLENWPLIVGESFCSRCSPVTILPGDALLIACANAVIRNELSLMKPLILRNISQLSRCKHIKDVRFRLI